MKENQGAVNKLLRHLLLDKRKDHHFHISSSLSCQMSEQTLPSVIRDPGRCHLSQISALTRGLGESCSMNSSLVQQVIKCWLLNVTILIRVGSEITCFTC